MIPVVRPDEWVIKWRMRIGFFAGRTSARFAGSTRTDISRKAGKIS